MTDPVTGIKTTQVAGLMPGFQAGPQSSVRDVGADSQTRRVPHHQKSQGLLKSVLYFAD